LKPQIRLLVSDLDNTLYDWVSFFVPAFYEMLVTASSVLNIPTEQLLMESRVVNRRFGTAERPFALLELPSVKERLVGLNLDDQKLQLNDAFHAFNRVRKQTLRLYPGVLDTFETITHSGTLLVAHTDAHVHNAMFRIKALGLRRLISRLYAPLSELDSEERGTEYGTFVSALPARHRKPNPRVLLDICADFDVLPDETLYIGDSIAKDIQMAKAAGVHSALAQYGAQHSPVLWDKLVRITHWSEEDANREKQLSIRSDHPEPEVKLNEIGELLQHFTFTSRRGSRRQSSRSPTRAER